ncbi:DUF2798 domain-containing protein [Vibrio sp. SCSIO 43136]|uniref:DUF2798 domain-containing protein n=1 Tax=Vibrio sp. SCSIO 43136 TaxID=2819101 RepID=UPI003365AA5C
MVAPPTPQTSKNPLWQKVMVIASMMTVMGGTLTGVMTYMNLGFSDSFFQDWATSFFTTTIFMMPIGFTMMNLVSKLVSKFMPNSSEKKVNLTVGLIMAVIMESLMAFSTAANNIGFNDLEHFVTSWAQAFAAALPVGITLMIIISMTIKPKIEEFLRS